MRVPKPIGMGGLVRVGGHGREGEEWGRDQDSDGGAKSGKEEVVSSSGSTKSYPPGLVSAK